MGERQSVSFVHSLLLSVQVFKMESHTKRFLRIFLSSSATFLQYLQSSSSSSFSGHTPPFLPSHFFIQGSYSGSLVFSALDEKEQESEFVAVNPARRSHRYILSTPRAYQMRDSKLKCTQRSTPHHIDYPTLLTKTENRKPGRVFRFSVFVELKNINRQSSQVRGALLRCALCQ